MKTGEEDMGTISTSSLQRLCGKRTTTFAIARNVSAR
jgi:hypothetical protein